MNTTDVQTPGNTTRPHPFNLGGARAKAGLIDIALIAAAVAPLAIINFGTAALAGFVIAVPYSALLEGGPSGQTVGKRLAGVRVVDAKTGLLRRPRPRCRPSLRAHAFHRRRLPPLHDRDTRQAELV